MSKAKRLRELEAENQALKFAIDQLQTKIKQLEKRANWTLDDFVKKEARKT